MSKNRRLFWWGIGFGLLIFVPCMLVLVFPDRFDISTVLDRSVRSTDPDRGGFIFPLLLLAIAIGELALLLGTIGIQIALARRARPSASMASAARSAWFALPILVLGLPKNGLGDTAQAIVILTVSGLLTGGLYGRRRDA